MKSDTVKPQSGSAGKEEKKIRQSISGPPQLTLDPERRRDFFNRLLEKYSTKSTKIANSQSGIGFGPRSARFPSVPPPVKAPGKIKEKFLKKKKSISDKSLVKCSAPEDFGCQDPMEAWKCSVRSHVFDNSAYKGHSRIKTRYPYPLPSLDEMLEPFNSTEGSDSEETKSGDTVSFESINHSFTFLPSGDQKHEKNESKVELMYEEKIVQGRNPLPEELQARHLCKTSSGTLIWVGNDLINSLLKKKNTKKLFAGEPPEKGPKTVRVEEFKVSGEGEERPPSKKNGKARKTKAKKNSSAQEPEDSSKVTKQLNPEKNVKPSSSSLPLLNQEDGKIVKKSSDKIKKPKKLTKKQAYTVVTSKPSV